MKKHNFAADCCFRFYLQRVQCVQRTGVRARRNLRERSLTIEGGEGRYYFKKWGPKNFSPSQVNSKNPAPSKNVCLKNYNPPLITLWVCICCIARIHISVTLRQLFHWNKKSATIYNIFGGRSKIIWILIFMIPVVFFLPRWLMIFFRIHDSQRLLISLWEHH